jgi:predicted TIM-barrel fold metal-dependent hydrolase
MMYSVDYPFSPTTRGEDFLSALQLNDADMAAFSHGNAERLLRL